MSKSTSCCIKKVLILFKAKSLGTLPISSTDSTLDMALINCESSV